MFGMGCIRHRGQEPHCRMFRCGTVLRAEAVPAFRLPTSCSLWAGIELTLPKITLERRQDMKVFMSSLNIRLLIIIACFVPGFMGILLGGLRLWYSMWGSISWW